MGTVRNAGRALFRLPAAVGTPKNALATAIIDLTINFGPIYRDSLDETIKFEFFGVNYMGSDHCWVRHDLRPAKYRAVPEFCKYFSVLEVV